MALTRPRAAQIYDIDYKQATRVVTVANITLAGGAPSQVDGVNLSLNDRVLVTGQSTASQNGIYYVTTLGSGSNGTWSRSLDTNNTGEILTGTIVMVTEGTIYADTQWKLITDGVITVGVTEQVWVQNYSANSISSGTSNVTVLTNSSVLISSAGSANVLKVDSGTITVNANIVPQSNVTYSLGNTTNRFSNLWLSNTTIYLGNVTVGATATQLTVNGSNVVTATANADIQTSGNISATGNVTGNYILGNVFYANGISASKIYSGTSEVNVVSSGGNVNVTVGGTSNVAVFATTGEYVSGVVSASGNVTGGNVLTAGLISATANITGGNVLTGGLISATANITGGNLQTVGTVSATGNITTAGYFLGNVACASGIYASRIFNGTSEANIGTSGGNVNVSVGGTSNVAVFATTGEYISGVVSASGNVTGGNVLTAGLISATGAITSGANITGGNVLTGGLISATGAVTSGANITGGNLLTGGLISSTGNATAGNILTTGLISATGTITSGNIYTGGLSLTGNTITSSGTTLTIDPNGTGGVDGAVVIAGNLSVQGNVTYIDSNVITTNEKSITLANNASTGSLADGAGIDVGNTTIAYWRFNNATTSWQSNIGLTPSANATLNLGGTSNYWGTLYANAVSVVGNVTTAGKFYGNGATLSNVYAFSNVVVSGQNTINASSIASTLTFAAGANMVITTDAANSTVTIAYNNTSASSIFATGGDMGLVTQAVTSSEDLGLITDAVSTSYDLGTLVVSGLVDGSSILPGTTYANIFITNQVLTNPLSTTGNVTAAYFFGNGSQLTGITSSYGNANVVANLAALGSNPVSTTGNVTAGYFVGNGSALTGIVSSSSATTYTATQTLNGSSSTVALKVTNIDEPAVLTAAAPAATTNFYINSGAIQYYTANANANFTLNFAFSAGTALNTAMSTNDTMSCTLLVTNGASAYYPSAFQVDGSSSNVSVKWQGGTAPTSGDASAIDSYGFVIIKTGSAAYTILASQTKFA